MAIGRKVIGKRLPGPNKMRMGDVVAVPLGDGYWGYIREARDATCQILDALSQNELLSLMQIAGRGVLGWATYYEPWDHPTWIFLGKWPYDDLDQAWGPPEYWRDTIGPNILNIYHKGQLVCTTDERAIAGIALKEGWHSPGKLVVKIRQMHQMEADRVQIEKFAPFSEDWTSPDEEPTEESVWPDVFTCEQPKMLSEVKVLYPFPRWRRSGLSQYTEKACAAFAAIFDRLIDTLINLGEKASEEQKLAAFEDAVKSLNKLYRRNDSLIDTNEREELCQLCNLIAVAAGLKPESYGDGEGPATEWREW